ncbi:hypothetical protein [Streptomyces antarcticus]|uniref:hypothetical protein n=1 Tax=Streptomyces antarcticus TaxID=2996458 RepID=UPI00226FC2A2|nr:MULTISPECIES: hypothetical protein [unclassified Streptomyces]MCY0940908.1 hypothetical protein [Streptomyces sp. H34-AA3]MCZ4083154.1 hypothetical protein [Streptomyces sp. H34-S5]
MSWSSPPSGSAGTPSPAPPGRPNLLKLAEPRNLLTDVQVVRWAPLKVAYVRSQPLGGPDGDLATRAVAAPALLANLLADRLAAGELAIRAYGP